MSHIFISYSREDQAYAGKLADDIRAHGFDVWIDDRIDFGDRWFEEIERAIIACAALVIIMSPASRRSKWVQREILIADRDGKPIFPLLLAGREFGNLIDIQSASVTGGILPRPDFYERLAEVIQPAKHRGEWVAPGEAALQPAARAAPTRWIAALVFLLLIVGIVAVLMLNDGGDGTPGLVAQGTRTATPTFTPTPTITPALVRALEGVESNHDWTPHFQNVDGHQMALVPRGCFTMGSVIGQRDEIPTTDLCFDAPFWIDVTEVTNAQIGSFGRFRGENRPRDTINWFEARDYCVTRGGRLPSEAEWEYAAKGPDGLVYPWGDEFDADRVTHEANSEGESADVGQHPEGASWVGALDMSGNLWEWTSSIYRDYPYDGREGTEASDEALPVLRGGSWTSNATRLTTSYRENSRPSYSDEYFGFRCVLDFEG